MDAGCHRLRIVIVLGPNVGFQVGAIVCAGLKVRVTLKNLPMMMEWNIQEPHLVLDLIGINILKKDFFIENKTSII